MALDPFPFKRALNVGEGVDTPIAAELALRLKDGDRIILVGPRGYGKTTTVRRVESALVTEGVTVAHFSITGMAPSDMKRRINQSAEGVVLVDDLDQAPPETASALSKIVPTMAGVLVATSRFDNGFVGSRRDLEPLARAALRDFLVRVFVSAGHDATRSIDELLDLSEGHPQRTLQLAHELWEQVKRGFRPDDAWRVAQRTVRAYLADGFEILWASHSDTDHRVLEAFANGQDTLFSRETLQRFALSKAGASRGRARMLGQGHLRVAPGGYYAFTDPLYADWVRRREEPVPVLSDADALRPGVPPFGDPDGARADLDVVMADYVPLGLLRGRQNDLGASMITRIVAGRKGSGKTLFLRRLHALARAEDGVYADEISATTPTTSEIVRIASLVSPAAVTETWTALWRIAILRATASHVLHAFALARHVDLGVRPKLEDLLRQLGSRSSVPRSIGAEFRDILAEMRSPHMLERTIQRYEWDDLAYSLAGIIQDLPPMFFYLDALDDEFANAPKYWLDCQVGLVHAVTRLMRDPRLGGRLHVVVSVRDVVLSAILRSEHGTRFAGDPHIETLDWDEPMIRRFLREKVRRLPGSFSTVGDWLAIERIPDACGGETDLETYLVRHTRLLPRDITILGNRLYSAATSAVNRGECVTLDDIRAATEVAARSMGIEELAILGNELAAEMMPPDAPDHGYADTYSADEPLSRELSRLIVQGLRGLSNTVVTETRLHDFAAKLALPAGVLSSLWRHRLLGYREGDHEVFRTADLDELALPAGRETYVLHPVLQAALT